MKELEQMLVVVDWNDYECLVMVFGFVTTNCKGHIFKYCFGSVIVFQNKGFLFIRYKA